MDRFYLLFDQLAGVLHYFGCLAGTRGMKVVRGNEGPKDNLYRP